MCRLKQSWGYARQGGVESSRIEEQNATSPVSEMENYCDSDPTGRHFHDRPKISQKRGEGSRTVLVG